jgi:hypothetical protein
VGYLTAQTYENQKRSYLRIRLDKMLIII